MPPALSWADLSGARVGVWGARVEGAANLRRLAAAGVVPAAVVDDAEPGPVEGHPVLTTAAGGLAALAACEVVVKSPGISRHRAEVADLEAAGVVVTGGLALWLVGVGGEAVVAITGSKGKSTTTAVAGHLAAGLGRRPFVGGNLGSPPWDPAAPRPPGGPDLWVVEVSSFQAADVARSPRVVVVTALSPDHLDWHGDVETYYADKLSLCHQPGATVSVVNGDDPELRARSHLLGPRVRWVRLDQRGSAPGGALRRTARSPAGEGAAGEGGLSGRPGWGAPGWTAALGLVGAHNARNALIAAAALQEAGVSGADDPDRLVRAAAGFEPLPSRLQQVAEVGGVRFFDDSLSTNVAPTLAALEVFADERVALLAGGHDRGLDYAPLAAALLDRAAPTLLLALPDNGSRIVLAVDATRRARVVEGAGAGRPGGRAGCAERSGSGIVGGGAGTAGGAAGTGLEVRPVADLAEAVAYGWGWARPRGVVLLSPAAASFGRFRDYRDRSAAFARAVGALTGAGGGAERWRGGAGGSGGGGT